MTSKTPPPWDDERIGAAYRALTETPVPDAVRSMTTVTSVKVAPRSVRPWLLAAAAVVALIVGAVGIASISTRGGPGPAASASAVPTTAPSTGAPPSPSASTILKVIDVAELVALQQGKFDDRELAVHGYLSPFLALPCPYPGELPVLVLRCPQTFQFLMRDPEILQAITSDGSTFHGPRGPSVNPRLLETLGGTPFAMGGTPDEVIAIGHLDDARAGDCTPEQLDECRQAFVIDRLAPAGSPIDLSVPAQVIVPPTAAHTPAEVVEAVAAATGMPPQVLVLSGFGSVAELTLIQPAVNQTSGLDGPVWLVRLLGLDGVGRTFVVADQRIGDPSMPTFELGRGSPIIGVPGTPVETGSPEPTG